MKTLVSGYLERVSSEVFDVYHDEIAELVGKQHGVYALYKNARLYYVGLAINLRTRIKQHLRDKHANKWDRFSIYLIREAEYLKDLESLVIHISAPTGNVKKGGFGRSQNLIKRLRKLMQERNRKSLAQILSGVEGEAQRSGKARKKSKRPGMRGSPPLAGFLPAGTQIKAAYKKQEFIATVDAVGMIAIEGRIFNSPSAAGSHVRNSKATDGWVFWKYQNEHGEWVKIDVLRRR